MDIWSKQHHTFHFSGVYVSVHVAPIFSPIFSFDSN